MKSEYAIGIDIGDTNIKGGLVSAEGEMIARSGVPTEEQEGKDQLLSKITTMVEELVDKAPSRPVAAGIGTPGFVDSVAASSWTVPGMG